MAAILDIITVGEILILSVDSDPSAGLGTPAPAGSLALYNGFIYTKQSASDTDWTSPTIPRVASTATSATPTPNADTTDLFILTALASAAAFGAPTGTPKQGQVLGLRIKDDGTARALSFNVIYRFSNDLLAPTTTIINKTLYMFFIYNLDDNKWDCLNWINN